MAIRVKGETYGDAAELVDEIGRLNATLAEMPPGQEAAALRKHIDDLNAALPHHDAPERAESDGGATVAGTGAGDGVPSDEDDDGDDDARRELADAETVCPMCGGIGTLATDPPDDPNRTRCRDCDGWGKVYTGSRVPGYEVKDCLTCNGEGAVAVAGYVQQQTRRADEAADVPLQAGALWDAATLRWRPPLEQQPPWTGATWDELKGGWA